MTDLVIREFRSDDSFAELTDLLHTAYFPLTKEGLHFFASMQTEEDTRERVGRAFVTYLGLLGTEMVSTISLYKPVPDHQCEHYHIAWYFGQFAVRPDLQKTGIGSHLIELVEARARAEGATHFALDTADTATKLVDYYYKRGFEFVQYVQWPYMKHRSVILSKKLGNDS